jgi:hypothetical protein
MSENHVRREARALQVLHGARRRLTVKHRRLHRPQIRVLVVAAFASEPVAQQRVEASETWRRIAAEATHVPSRPRSPSANEVRELPRKILMSDEYAHKDA